MQHYPETVGKLNSLYCYYKQKYIVMTHRYTKTVDHYFKNGVIESHLNGFYALGVFAGEKATRFISVDVDAGGKAAVRKVVDAFEELGIPRSRMYISTSGKKGYHVDMFFSPWIYNERAKNLYDLMIWRSGLDPKKVEFRPTHTQAVKIPLGIHATTGNRCWFLDQKTLEPIENMDYIQEIELMPSDLVFAILKKWNKKRWNELYAEMICNDSGKDNSIARGIEFNAEYYNGKRLTKPGTRHDTMVEIAHDLRMYGANRFQIGKALRGFYYRQDPMFIESSEQLVLDDIDEIAEWAEENVNVVFRRTPSKSAEPKMYGINKYDANAILMAPTETARRVALLIYIYCKIFGAAHLSYERIGQDIGCSLASVKKAIGYLVERRIINRESGGCHYQNGMLVRKSNTYFIPKEYVWGLPPKEDILVDEVSMCEKVTKETFDGIYRDVFLHMFSADYLRRFMTKPEFNRVTGQ